MKTMFTIVKYLVIGYAVYLGCIAVLIGLYGLLTLVQNMQPYL